MLAKPTRVCHPEALAEGSGFVKEYYVYIITNHSKTLYIGVTNNLVRRIYEHSHRLMPGFTSKYNISKLVYFEQTSDVKSAIEREKYLKGKSRAFKIELIEAKNPNWDELSI